MNRDICGILSVSYTHLDVYKRQVYSKYVKLRNDKGITDYRVAIDTGIRRSTFSDWKSGRSKDVYKRQDPAFKSGGIAA